MQPSPRTRGLGLRIFVFSRGHLWVYFRYGPVTRSPSLRWLCRSASPASLSSAGTTQAKELLTFAPVGLPPTEHVCLSWTHSFAKTPSTVENGVTAHLTANVEHATRLSSEGSPMTRRSKQPVIQAGIHIRTDSE